MPFQCTVVTPEQQILDETASQVILPAHDGQLGILSDRAPILVKLGLGALRVDVQGGQTKTFFIDGGVAQMNNNKLTILTDEATPASQINVEEARAEQAEAAARVATDAPSKQARERAVQRARVKQQVAGKH